MSPERLAWIKRYAKSPAQQRATFGMPEALKREAEHILARAERGDLVGPRERMRALSIGTAAAMAAILLRASPMRAKNLHALRHQGPDAEILVEGDHLKIEVPGAMVKNGTPIDVDGDADCLPIVQWYLDAIRSWLIEDHPYGKPAADSDYLFAGPRGNAPLDRTTLEKRFDEGVAAAGLDMTLHQLRHVCAYHILDIDPNAWAEAAEVLGDKVSTVRKYYAWMDARKVGRRGREHLREARRQSGRHRRGHHHHDSEGRSDAP